jgi:hypothetical protein
MCSSTRAEIDARFAALDAAVSGLLELSFDVLTTPERLRLLERLEQHLRRLPVPGPPHLDHGQPRVNTFHHPEKLLHDDDEDDP